MATESALKLNFEAEAPPPPDPPPKRRGGRPPGSQRAKQHEKLAAAGVALDDPQRPTDGKRRKPAGVTVGPGLRDGANMPLRKPDHEEVARKVAGGLPPLDAAVLTGYSRTSPAWLHLTRDPDFVARVAELQDQYAKPLGPATVGFLQRRQLAIASNDIGGCFERPSYGGRSKPKDILDLSPEQRACVAEVSYDKHGRQVLKFHDPAKAASDIIRQATPQRVEMSGPDGGPMQLESMLTPESIGRLSDDELTALKTIVSKLVAAGPVVEVEPDDVKDGA